MRIGVISDTHGYLDPKISSLFHGVEHILHAGDVGLPWVVFQLEQIAPVTAVAGNTDTGMAYNDTEIVLLAGRKFFLHHIVDVHHPASALQGRLLRENPRVVVFGHTHKPFCQTIEGRLYFNPGYAGKKRFSLPRSVATLDCLPDGIRTEFKSLED